jgi:2-polyprenyl-6-methoxyphenol hydroxylase-like FAD-dependent oxidoreductase
MNDVRADAPVIIVGGGPVGLALALGLAHHGMRSVLFERRAEVAPDSRSMPIWPRTQEILRDWGAYEPIAQRGHFIESFRALNVGTGKQLVEVDFRAVDDVVDRPGVLVVSQGDVERALRLLVAAHPLCDLRLGIAVTGLQQDNGGVTITYAIDGTCAELRAAVAVGCDGSQSAVRGWLGVALEGDSYDSRVVLSDELLDDVPDDDAIARIRLGVRGLRCAIRVAPRTWRAIASVDREDAQEQDDCAHRQRLRDIFGDCEPTTLWKQTFEVHRRHAQRFVLGRVALAGDAAHVSSPIGGQGLNAGIHDAANLAWKIAFAFKDGQRNATLFESYDIERREMVTDTVERYADRLTRIGVGFTRRAKQFAVRAASRAVRGRGMQRKLCRALGMLGGRYTLSPIIDSHHPLAGKRIDDLRLADGRRLNAIRGGGAAFVIVGTLGFDLAGIRVPIAPRRWHVKASAVLVVRPDGCVAAVVEKPTRERVEQAWQAAFCGTIALPAASAQGTG